MINKLKALEKSIVFLCWAGDQEFGRIKYVGEDFIEFEILNQDTLEYTEDILINSQAILEVTISAPELSRVIAKLCANLPEIQGHTEY